MFERNEINPAVSHYIDLKDGNRYIGFFGFDDSVYIKENLLGKKLGKYGEVTSFNSELAQAIEDGLVDKNGQITEQESLEKKSVIEEVNVKGHENEPRTDRANSGKKPITRGVNPGHADWLENGPGRHGDIGEKVITPKTLNKLWKIFLENNKDFFEDDLDVYRKIEILEENDFVFQNKKKEYELSEKGKRKLDDLKKQEQTRLSLENKRRKEKQQEEHPPLQRIERALKGLKTIDSYTIRSIEGDKDNLFEVKLNLQDGSELSKTIEVREETTLKEIRTKFVKLLKRKLDTLKNS